MFFEVCKSMASGDLLLTYKQSTVYASDVSTLGDRKWLNDTIIGFAYDIFANKVCNNAAQDSLLFVHPTTVNVIKFENDEEDLIPLIVDAGIQTYNYIFFPINNSQSMFSVSGSHWALMIYQRDNNTFYYLDSAGIYNLTYAQKFANKIYPYINPKKNDNDNDKTGKKKDEEKDKNIDYVKVLNNFVKMEVPQQENSYDCGMYVVEFTGFIAKYFMDKFGEKKDKNKDKDDGKVNDKDKDKDQDKDKQYPSISKINFYTNKDIKFDADYMVKMRQHWRKVINDMAKDQIDDKK